MSMKLKLKDN